MEKIDALSGFAALSQQTRLDVFRLLVRAGQDGMQAGELCDALDVRPNTMSANLSVLLNAGLVRNSREGRYIRYFADMDGLRGILNYLLADCCGGAPDLCRPLLNDLLPEA